MEFIGYLASILIGISLGMTGIGGSILTVPVLVYFFGIDPSSATTYSLCIVGIASLSGSVNFFLKKMIDIRLVTLFGIPSFGTAYDNPLLSNEEAWDVAAFVNSQPHPSRNFTDDWPSR